MEGREPDPPEDWSDSGSDSSGGAEVTSGEADGRSPIGGPAEQV
jgi:hypothetical protein